jgi:hypothetical protein
MKRSYLGGVLAGFGLCAIGIKYFDREQGVSVLEEPLWLVGGLILFLAGSLLARSARRRIEHRRFSTPTR